MFLPFQVELIFTDSPAREHAGFRNSPGQTSSGKTPGTGSTPRPCAGQICRRHRSAGVMFSSVQAKIGRTEENARRDQQNSRYCNRGVRPPDCSELARGPPAARGDAERPPGVPPRLLAATNVLKNTRRPEARARSHKRNRRPPGQCF